MRPFIGLLRMLPLPSPQFSSRSPFPQTQNLPLWQFSEACSLRRRRQSFIYGHLISQIRERSLREGK